MMICYLMNNVASSYLVYHLLHLDNVFCVQYQVIYITYMYVCTKHVNFNHIPLAL